MSRAAWRGARIFGRPEEAASYVVRPSAYALIPGANDTVAIVRTPQGSFLPGGGIEAGETPEAAIRRESLEECGLRVRVGGWSARAVQFVYSPRERTHFEKLSSFIEATDVGPSVAPFEPDHELLWLGPTEAAAQLSHESHQWAVEEWTRVGRTKLNEHRETMEWLGLMPADVMDYGAWGAVIAMYFSRSPMLDALLAGVACALALAACRFGMRDDPSVSRLVKRLKRVSYLVHAGLIAIVIGFHYLWWVRAGR